MSPPRLEARITKSHQAPPGAAVAIGAAGYVPAMNATVLWVIAVILAIIGIVQLLQGQLILGIILLVAAAAVGPGGWSVFRSRA